MSKFKELLSEYVYYETDAAVTPQTNSEREMLKLFKEKLIERDRKLVEALKEVASYGGSWETLVKNVFKEIGEEY